MKKLRIMVLMHESLTPPYDTKNTDLASAPWRTEYDVMGALERLGHSALAVGVSDDLGVIRVSTRRFKPDLVFNLLEEFDGVATYDQNVVSFLELSKIPYTGCNPRGLMLARDKAISKKVLSYHRIPCPKFHVIQKGHKASIPKDLQYPVIVKSLIEEASLGISQASIVDNDKKMFERVSFIHESIGTDAILEQYIDGRELYVGVFGNSRLSVLPVWELSFGSTPSSAHNIATQTVKWNEKYRKKHQIKSSGAELSFEEISQIQALCKRVYKRLELNGYARIDLRYANDKKIYVIEANPNPGIAKDEEFSRAAQKGELSYDELIQKIITLGLSWHHARD